MIMTQYLWPIFSFYILTFTKAEHLRPGAGRGSWLAAGDRNWDAQVLLCITLKHMWCTGIITHMWLMQCNAHTNTNRYLLSVKPTILEMGLTLQDRWHLRMEKQSEDSDNKHCSVFRSLKWIKQVTKTASMACISFVSLGSLQWVHPTHPNKVWTHRHPRTTVLLSSSAVDYRYRYCAGSGWLWGEAISCTLPPWWRSSPVWRGRGRKRVHSSPKAPITPLHHPLKCASSISQFPFQRLFIQ